MEKFFCSVIACLFLSSVAFALLPMEVSDSDGETTDFWPCDWIPHPTLPGDGPSGPAESEWAGV